MAYGNPDTADHVAVGVPGIMNDGSTIDSGGQSALDLWSQASKDGRSVASIAWIGYNSPDINVDEMDPTRPIEQQRQVLDILSVGGEEFAEAGGHHLADFVSGLRDTHEGIPAHLTVIGHSYGSTTVAHALADGIRNQVDDAILVGSPGAGGGVDSADDLMKQGHLYVGSKDRDFVTWFGHEPGEYSVPRVPQSLLDHAGLGEDPSQADFGATRFDVGQGDVLRPDPVLGISGSLANHTSYYEGQSLSTMGDIVAGRGVDADQVIAGRDVNGVQLAVRAEIEGQVQFVRDAGDGVLNLSVDAAHQAVDTGVHFAHGAVEVGSKVIDGAGQVLDHVPRLPLLGPSLPSVPTFSGVFDEEPAADRCGGPGLCALARRV